MEPLHSVVYLLVGLVVGAVLVLKPQVLKELPTAAYAYLCFGLLLFGASWVASWIGFASVIVAHLLYQGSKGALSENVRYIATFQWWPKRQKKETTQPTAGEVESQPTTEPAQSAAEEESHGDQS
jgi:uncharacterized membrane protein